MVLNISLQAAIAGGMIIIGLIPIVIVVFTIGIYAFLNKKHGLIGPRLVLKRLGLLFIALLISIMINFSILMMINTVLELIGFSIC